MLERISRAVVIEGDEWVLNRRKQPAASAFAAIVMADALLRAEDDVATALGLLESGDTDSALLCARMALGNLVDALVASQGELGQEQKWRARRMRLTNPGLLSYRRYWQLETMQTFDPARPGQWVDDVARLVQSISRELAL